MTRENQALLLLALSKYCVNLQKETNNLRAQAKDPENEPYQRSLYAKAKSLDAQMRNVRWIVLRFKDDLNEIFGTDDLSEIATFPFEDAEETLGLDIMDRIPITKLGVRKPDNSRFGLPAHSCWRMNGINFLPRPQHAYHDDP